MKSGFICVVCRLRLGYLDGDGSEIDDGNRATPRVTPNSSNSAVLLQPGIYDAGLFLQLPRSTGFQVFLRFKESAWKSPQPLKWRMRPAHQQYLQLLIVEGEDHIVRRDKNL